MDEEKRDRENEDENEDENENENVVSQSDLQLLFQLRDTHL